MPVKDTKNLRKDLATYYDFFSTKTVRDEPIISIPYIDAFGTGKKALSDVVINGLVSRTYFFLILY